jgi:hypothetical protein
VPADQTRKRLEKTTKQVEQIARLQNTGSESSGFEMHQMLDQNARSTVRNGNLHILNAVGPPVHIFSDIILEISQKAPSPMISQAPSPMNPVTHKDEHSGGAEVCPGGVFF